MKLAVLVIILILAIPVYADFRQVTKSSAIDINPKHINSLTVKITKSGTLTVTGGSVKKANLTLFIPQEGIEDIEVSADDWKYINDKYGNRLVLLEWDFPPVNIDYSVATTIKSNAYFLNEEKFIGINPAYLKENSQIVFNDKIREAAYPFNKNFEHVAYLTRFVHNLVDYDLSYVGQLKPSDWVMENKKGVCVEYANLLSSLLKVSGIPTRYVVGYAYSTVEKQLIGHTWVEVLAHDGTWVPFDPTWLEGGYLDATHIKTAVREDANQSETLVYVGTGKVKWEQNNDEIEIIDYTTFNLTQISIETPETLAFNEFGYIKASITSSSCTITDITAISCTQPNRVPVFDIYDAKRDIWQCGRKDIYWAFAVSPELKKNYIYTCPVTVYDQMSATIRKNLDVSGTKDLPELSISGPSTVGSNEQFTLTANTEQDFIFFSPNLTSSEKKNWDLHIPEEGTYRFYLYSDGGLDIKDVNVVKRKEFDIFTQVPSNITQGSNFTAYITAVNLLPTTRNVKVQVEFQGNKKEQIVFFDAREEKILSFDLNPKDSGDAKLTVFVFGDSLNSYTTSLHVLPRVQTQGSLQSESIIDNIVAFFEGLIKSIGNMFS